MDGFHLSYLLIGFLGAPCCHNLQCAGQTSTFVYLYHSLLTKEVAFIKEINHQPAHSLIACVVHTRWGGKKSKDKG